MLVVALLPRIALPCKETRAGVPARDITLRFATLRDAFATVPRDTTLRPLAVVVGRVVVVRDAVALGRVDVVRDADAVVARVAFPVVPVRDAAAVVAARVVVVRAVVARVETERDGETVVADAVPRDTVFAALRRDVAFARGDAVPARVAWGAATIADVAIGAIGSANTARIETNVEQTKNAPASKNTVPIAFLQKSVILRLFIKFSL